MNSPNPKELGFSALRPGWAGVEPRAYSSCSWSCLRMRAFFLLTSVNHSWISTSSCSLLAPEPSQESHQVCH